MLLVRQAMDILPLFLSPSLSHLANARTHHRYTHTHSIEANQRLTSSVNSIICFVYQPADELISGQGNGRQWMRRRMQRTVHDPGLRLVFFTPKKASKRWRRRFHIEELSGRT